MTATAHGPSPAAPPRALAKLADVLAVILGVIDIDRTGTSSRETLDKIVGRRT